MKLSKQRPYNYLDYFSVYKNSSAFDTINTVDEELWFRLNSLRVKDIAQDFLYPLHPRKSLSSREKLSTKLVKFIEQAEFFYKKANESPIEVSPLLYYYGMLNLTKAYIISRKPSLLRNDLDLKHGLSDPNGTKKSYTLSKESLNIQGRGVFASYYECLMNKKIRRSGFNNISIKLLISYCVDISAEYSELFKKKRNLIHCAVYVVRNNKKKGWSMIYFDKKSLKERNISITNLIERAPSLANYKRVKSPDKKNNKSFVIFQHKEQFNAPNYKTLRSGGYEQLKNFLFCPHFVFEKNHRQNYSLPLLCSSSPSPIAHRLPESMIIYMIIFYLGSLVRYHPYVLSNLFNTKEGWILESFIRTCPKKFLRSMVCNIFDTEFIINPK